LKIGNLSTQLESEVDETWELSSRTGICYVNPVVQMRALNALKPPTQDPH